MGKKKIDKDVPIKILPASHKSLMDVHLQLAISLLLRMIHYKA